MKNKARRNGATIVHNARTLRALACLTDDVSRGREGFAQSSYPDWSTFVFSATISSEMFKIYVHWAEVEDQQGEEMRVHWHMNLVEETSLTALNACEQASRWCHNILEWMCFTRKSEIMLLRHHLFNQELVKQGKLAISKEDAKDRSLLYI